MVTSIFLFLAFFPAPTLPVLFPPDSRADQAALTAGVPGDGVPCAVTHSDPADEESEDEEFGGSGPAAEALRSGSDAVRVVRAQPPNGWSHLRTVRYRRGSARSPPTRPRFPWIER
jgi:hypothetical protein